jgi:hypothetical protein
VKIVVGWGGVGVPRTFVCVSVIAGSLRLLGSKVWAPRATIHDDSSGRFRRGLPVNVGIKRTRISY